MSSLAASRADNYYFPPEWTPDMGGISKYQGSNGSNQYEKYGIIRFELPFDAWCLKCKRHMSKGLRFNAKKEKAGKYFTTQIWSFTTKCYSCDQKFIILTDPENRTYQFDVGLRKHEQDYTPEKEDSVIEILDDESKAKIKNDPMFKLQHENEDMRKIKTEEQRINYFINKNEKNKTDYDNNALLRSIIRTQKKKEKKRIEEGKNRGLSIPILDENEDDALKARNINFKSKSMIYKSKEKKKINSIMSQPILKSSKISHKSMFTKTNIISRINPMKFKIDCADKSSKSQVFIQKKQI